MYESFIIYSYYMNHLFSEFSVDEYRLWLIVGNWNQGVWVNSAEQWIGGLEVALGLTFYVIFSSMNHIQATQLAMIYDTPSGGFHSYSPHFHVRKWSSGVK